VVSQATVTGKPARERGLAVRRGGAAALALAIVAAALSGCGGTELRRFDAPPDPYHYRQPFQAG